MTPLTKCPNCQNPICSLGGNRFCGACGHEYPLNVALDLEMQNIEVMDASGTQGTVIQRIRKCTDGFHALQTQLIKTTRSKIPEWNEKFCSKCGAKLIED